MDLLDRLLAHDVWTTQELLRRAETLSEEQLDQEFEISHKTVRATFDHLIFNMQAWADDMAGRPIERERDRSLPELAERLGRAATALAEVAKPIAEREGWDEEWTELGTGVKRTYGGTIAHVITHSMHHRAQLIYMLRMLGVDDLPEGDVLSWESQNV